MLNSHSIQRENGKISMLSTAKGRMVFYITVSAVYLFTVLIVGLTMNVDKYAVDYSLKFTKPCLEHIFGTDYMGRVMFWRCI